MGVLLTCRSSDFESDGAEVILAHLICMALAEQTGDE